MFAKKLKYSMYISISYIESILKTILDMELRSVNKFFYIYFGPREGCHCLFNQYKCKTNSVEQGNQLDTNTNTNTKPYQQSHLYNQLDENILKKILAVWSLEPKKKSKMNLRSVNKPLALMSWNILNVKHFLISQNIINFKLLFRLPNFTL